MKRFRLVALMLAVLAIVNGSFAAAFAESSNGVLDELTGTYEELFPVLNAQAYDVVWLEECAKHVGAEEAQASADKLKAMVVGELYGQEAVDAYAADPADMKFNCFFLNDVALLTFDGNRISGTDKEGNPIFSHTYAYLGSDNEVGLAVYQSSDSNSGEFAYFVIAPDTPETTYHIEFRYGSDADALVRSYIEGPYAYWLAGGIPVERDDSLAKNAIALFCEENLAAESEEAA